MPGKQNPLQNVPYYAVFKVFQQGILITNLHNNATKQLPGRCIRMRAHISTKHTEKLNLQKKKKTEGKGKKEHLWPSEITKTLKLDNKASD